MKDIQVIGLKYYVIVGLFLICSASYAQFQKDKSQIALITGINTNEAYELELSYHYMLFPYLGIGSSVGFFNQWYNEYLPYGKSSVGGFNSWILSDSDKKIGKLYLRPSILLATPALFNIRVCQVSLLSESGVQLLFPHTGVYIDYVNSNNNDTKSMYKSTNKGQWCFWNFKGFLNLKIQDTSFAFGYGISNLDIFDSRKHINVDGQYLEIFYPDKKLTHSFFIRFDYSF